MRKHLILAATLLSAVLSAKAQSWQDAYAYAENNYVGTARSVGMGNAMTAIGGDVGSLTFNPAGSAVSAYSQFTFTPSLSIASAAAQGVVEPDGSILGFGQRTTDGLVRFKVPNVGIITTMDTHNYSGIKRITFGLVANATNDYTTRMSALGSNAYTTLAGALATQANGYTEAQLDGSFFTAGGPYWRTMTGYQSGMFSLINGTDNEYAGITERVLDNGDIQLCAPLEQRYVLRNMGNKYDVLMNMAIDVNDKLYVGFNLGITSLSFKQNVLLSEAPDGDPAAFVSNFVDENGQSVQHAFASLRQESVYRVDGSGVYAKAGFLWRPVAGLRIGGAISTPTFLEINETYALEGQTVVDGKTYTSTSPEDEWRYDIVSPYRMNVGIAYTFGRVGLLSVDYERTRFGQTRYRAYDWEDNTDFSGVNNDIRNCLGTSHALRAGMELRPTDFLALRTGYNLSTSAIAPDVQNVAARQSVSFGLGFSSAGSFFADASVRMHWLPTEYVDPYYYDVYDANGNPTITCPEIAYDNRLVDVLLTLGWRF